MSDVKTTPTQVLLGEIDMRLDPKYSYQKSYQETLAQFRIMRRIYPNIWRAIQRS